MIREIKEALKDLFTDPYVWILLGLDFVLLTIAVAWGFVLWAVFSRYVS